MKAEEVTAGRLFGSDQQLLIPLWQRRYSWDKVDWAELWQDLERLESGEAPSHFIGSVVLHALKWSGLPSEARRYWVVDGQQRITTLTILVCAIRDRLARLETDATTRAETMASYTSQLLRNTNLKADHQARLVLQDVDRGKLGPILDGDGADASGSLVERAYSFFAQELSTKTKQETEKLLTHVLVDLNAVWVTLEESDNAHRVFQTLNAGGKPLRQADLVRNYFFLLLGENGDEFYKKQWKNLETDLSTRELEDYFVAWSVSQGHTGAKDSLFRYFQKDLSQNESDVEAIESYGASLVDCSRLFSWIRTPKDMPIKPAKKVLGDLRNWGTLPVEGLLLFLLRRNHEGALDDKSLADGFEVVLSFLARRMLAGYEPQLHKSISTGTTLKLRQRSDLRDADLVAYLRLVLSSGEDVRTWPSDELIRERIVSNPLYTPSRSAWVFSILERINRMLFDYTKHAPPTLDRTQFTVEHVMPQTLSPEWEADLQEWGTDSPSKLHATRVHVLGNLTLSPINSELSNKPFVEKVEMLKDDWLRLNQDLVQASTWTESSINERSRALAKLAQRAFVPPMTPEEVSTSALGVDAAKPAVAPEDEAFEDEDEQASI